MAHEGLPLPSERPVLSLARARAVNAVYEAGTFSAAGRKLGLTQPAVTQLVRDLERAFGIVLFERRGQDLAPTAVCSALRTAILQLEAGEAEALAVLAQHKGQQSGELRVGLGNAMPGLALVREFQRLYPKVQVSVEMGDWSSIIAAVESQRIDVGLLPEVPDDGRFRREICVMHRVVAIVHPDHHIAGAPEVSCRELASQRLVFRPRTSSTQRVVDRAFRKAGLVPVPAIVLDTRDGVVEAVAHGMGVGFMWELASSRTDRLRKVPIVEARDLLPEYIFSLAGRRERRIDLFVDRRASLGRIDP